MSNKQYSSVWRSKAFELGRVMDASLALYVHEHMGTAWMGFFQAASATGRAGVIGLVVILGSLLLIFMGRFQRAHMLILSAVTGLLTSTVVKRIVGRDRPMLWEPGDAVNGYSFPSGHAIVTVVVYGLISYFLAESYPSRKKIIYGVYGVAMFVIGLSRVYLGVHWPSDVVAGWVVGGGLLALMIWWYKRGGIYRTIRVGIGLVFLVLGLVGLILPIIPGIPLMIAAVILIFSGKPFVELFDRKAKPPLGPKDIEIPNE